MDSNQLTWMIFGCAVLAIALSIIVVKTVKSVHRQNVITHSRLYLWCVRAKETANIKRNYKHQIPAVFFVNSLRSAKSFDFDVAFKKAVAMDREALVTAFLLHRQNEVSYEAYEKAKKIAVRQLRARPEDAKKAHVSFKNYRKIEAELLATSAVQPDREPISLSVKVSYTSPAGRSHYEYAVSYKEAQIFEYIKDPCIGKSFSAPSLDFGMLQVETEKAPQPEKVDRVQTPENFPKEVSKTKPSTHSATSPAPVVSETASNILSETVTFKQETKPTVTKAPTSEITSKDSIAQSRRSSPTFSGSQLLLRTEEGFFTKVGYRDAFVFSRKQSDYGINWRDAPEQSKYEFETFLAKMAQDFVNTEYPANAFSISYESLLKHFYEALMCDDLNEADLRSIFPPTTTSFRTYLTKDDIACRINSNQTKSNRKAGALKTKVLPSESAPVATAIPLPVSPVASKSSATPSLSYSINGNIFSSESWGQGRLIYRTKTGYFLVLGKDDSFVFFPINLVQGPQNWKEADEPSLKAIKRYLASVCLDVFGRSCDASLRSASPEDLAREVNHHFSTLAFSYRDILEIVCDGHPFNLVTIQDICKVAEMPLPAAPAQGEASPSSSVREKNEPAPSSPVIQVSSNASEKKAKPERILAAPYYSYKHAIALLQDAGISPSSFEAGHELNRFRYFAKDGYLLDYKYDRLSDCLYETQIVQGHKASFEYSNPENLPAYEKAVKTLENNLILFKDTGIYYTTCFAYESQGVGRVQINNFAVTIRQLSKRKQFFSYLTIQKAFATDTVMKLMGTPAFIEQIINAKCDVNKFYLDYEGGSYLYRDKNLENPEEVLIASCFKGRAAIEIYDVADAVLETYGLAYNLDKIVKDAKKTSFFYSESLEKIYKSKQDYLKEVYGK